MTATEKMDGISADDLKKRGANQGTKFQPAQVPGADDLAISADQFTLNCQLQVQWTTIEDNGWMLARSTKQGLDDYMIPFI
jgi:hypothetical protein